MTYPGGQYRGFGVFEEPPPPRDRTKPVIIGSLIAVVLIVAAVLAITLIDRERGTPVAQSTTTTTTKTTTTTTSAAPDGQPIENLAAKVRYTVPESWTVAKDAQPITLQTVAGVSITQLAGYGDYRCGGKSYSRGIVGSGTVARAEINQAGTDLARAFGTEFYSTGTGVEVTVGTPKKITRTADNGSAVEGVQVDATIVTTGNDCLASKGRVSVVLLDYADALRLVMVNGDLEGGPATPTPTTPADLQTIADSVRPG
ncbi:hypothetical protein [Actinokineospora sp.]|uniref:hypothetical protein n=1 Tax=Actinokineospora sp. TaxID=1872133 RepID=UPI0040377367